jgi:hypothetical protein
MRLENAVPSNNLLQLSSNADFQVVKRPIYYKSYDDSVHSEDDISKYQIGLL